MSVRGFVKHYATATAARRAVKNHRALQRVLPEALPRLIELDEAQAVVVLEDVGEGQVATDDDILEAARMIGLLQQRWIATAATRQLAAFSHERRALFESRLGQLDDPDSPLRSSAIDWQARWRHWDETAAGVYKDCNIHNFRVTPEIRFLDFDTLTAAPVGYDLAKLLVTAAMYRGRLPPLAEAIAAHDVAAGTRVEADQFAWFLELHWALTYPFAAKNGYRVPWPHLRRHARGALDRCG